MHHEKVRTVRLYGSLGASFGRVHRLAVSNASEAIHALCILVPGFERFLMESKDRGVTYTIFLGRDNIGQDRLKAPPGAADIRIAPVLMGSKRAGSMQTIIGVALIVAASYFSGGLASGSSSALIGASSTTGWTAIAGVALKTVCTASSWRFSRRSTAAATSSPCPSRALLARSRSASVTPAMAETTTTGLSPRLMVA